jgi:hypothetical protein
MAQPLVFDFYNSIIEVPAPDTSLDIQYLINQIRDTEDELTPGMDHAKIADASGKDDLGGGVYTAITVRLLDNWRVRFEARTELTQCVISGGNLVGGPGGNPVAPSAFTQVIQLSSASGTISTPDTAAENINIRYLLASLGETQKGIGDVYYWDPISGSDSNSGLTPTAAVQTFAKAHDDLVTTGHHDVIFCLSSDPTGITTVTETLNITKDTLKVRGPGHVFQLVPITTTDDTITISANDVEISGLYISTATSGTKNAVTVTGNNALIKDCWISIVRGHGLNLSSSAKTMVDTAVIEHCGASGTGNGVNLGQDTTEAKIKKCIIFDNKSGVLLSGTGIADNVIEDCLIYKNTAYGANIANSEVLRTTLRSGNTLTNNTPGNTLDNGTDTYIETPAGGASTSEIADAVWAEVITGVTTPGSAGKTLKDTKTKATLASLS